MLWPMAYLEHVLKWIFSSLYKFAHNMPGGIQSKLSLKCTFMLVLSFQDKTQIMLQCNNIHL